MRGRLFAVVGPSGVGKDTLMEAAQLRLPALHLVRRVITRPASAGGEDFEGVSPETFAARKARGDFALDWQAHGLSYGIPAQIDALLADGVDVVFNGSRGVLVEATQKYPQLQVLHITAAPKVLATRLAARGRESRADIERRLKRADFALPKGLNVIPIHNDGALEDAVDALCAALQPVSA